MAYDRDKYAAVLAYLPHEMKARMARIKECERRYSLTRILEEALSLYLPKLEQQHGIKPPKQSKSKEV